LVITVIIQGRSEFPTMSVRARAIPSVRSDTSVHIYTYSTIAEDFNSSTLLRNFGFYDESSKRFNSDSLETLILEAHDSSSFVRFTSLCVLLERMYILFLFQYLTMLLQHLYSFTRLRNLVLWRPSSITSMRMSQVVHPSYYRRTMNLVRLWKQHGACKECQKFSNRHERANKHMYMPAALAVTGDLHPLWEAWTKFRGKIQRGDCERYFPFSRDASRRRRTRICDRTIG
jgi:hypothetical protein